VEVVESRLTDGHGCRVLEQLGELPEPVCVGSGGTVRIDPERRRDALLRRRDLERRPARSDAGADGETHQMRLAPAGADADLVGDGARRSPARRNDDERDSNHDSA